MARYALRRLLLMIPTFLGITVVTFLLVNAMGDDLDSGDVGEVSLARRELGAQEARRLRQVLGRDKPLLFNTDVEDVRRRVQAAAERVSDVWENAWPELVRICGESQAEAHLAHHLEQAGRLLESADALVPPASADERSRFLARAGSVGKELARATLDLNLLSRLGDQTLRYLGDCLEGDTDPGRGAAERLLLAVASRLAGSPLPTKARLAGHAATRRDAWSPNAIDSAVQHWLDVARRAEGRGDPGFIGADHQLRMLGGLCMATFVPRLLEEPPEVKALATGLLRDGAAWDGAYQLHRGAPSAAAQTRARQGADDSRLASWWRRSRLGFTEISGASRWAWHSWTHTRYGHWLGSMLRFDFGSSLELRRPVSSIIAERLPRTALLGALALALMYAVAVPLGAWSALRGGSRREGAVSLLLLLLYAAPSFWVATLCVLHLGDVFPIHGFRSPEVGTEIEMGRLSAFSWTAVWDLIQHLVLPTLVLSYAGLTVLARHAQAGMLDVLGQDYIRTAHAKGLPGRVVLFKHALRNGILPLVTLFGALLPTLVGGSVVVERVFGIEGMGLLAWDAAQKQDIPVVMGVVTLSALVTMAGYLVSDLLSAWLDPRISLS